MELPDGEPYVKFQATCRGAKIDSQGQVCLDIVVPKDQKYNSLPITDLGNGVKLTFVVWNWTPPDFEDNPLIGFTFPEGMESGDGSGTNSYRGGKRESDNVDEGKITLPMGHRKAYT